MKMKCNPFDRTAKSLVPLNHLFFRGLYHIFMSVSRWRLGHTRGRTHVHVTGRANANMTTYQFCTKVRSPLLERFGSQNGLPRGEDTIYTNPRTSDNDDNNKTPGFRPEGLLQCVHAIPCLCATRISLPGTTILQS